MNKDSKIIVWDTEFTSWEGCIDNGWNNDRGEYKELIQIGAFELNSEKEIIGSFNEYIKPKINPELSEYIRELTGIEQEEIDRADEFESVWEKFRDWAGDYPHFSWGNDVDVVERNINLYNLNMSIKRNFFDIRPIFALHGVPVSNWTSGTLYKYFEIDSDIHQHNAKEDAKSLVMSLNKLN